MPLMTPQQFEESLKHRKPRVFMNGKRVENIFENRNTRTVDRVQQGELCLGP